MLRKTFWLVCRGLGLLATGCFILIAYSPFPNWLNEKTETRANLQPCDAIVVLGSELLPQGTLGSSSFRRAVAAVVLYKQKLAPQLLFLGADAHLGYSEAKIRRDLAIDLGVPSDAILTNSDGATTKGEAIASRTLLQPKGVRRILIVTDSQHMTRALTLFRDEGFEVFPASIDHYPNPAEDEDEKLDLISRVSSEGLARAYRTLTALWKH